MMTTDDEAVSDYEKRDAEVEEILEHQAKLQKLNHHSPHQMIDFQNPRGSKRKAKESHKKAVK